MDFVFDRVASGRVIKMLVIVDDATHEAVAIIPEHTIGGDHLVRILDQVCALRGRPGVIRSDNGKEFTGKAMLTWAHRNGVALRLISGVIDSATRMGFLTFLPFLLRAK